MDSKRVKKSPMAYKISPNGTVETDNIDEAVELSRKLASIAQGETRALDRKSRISGGEIGAARDGGFSEFLKAARPHQLKVLRLLQVEGAVTVERLSECLGAKNNQATTGTLLGLSKGLAKHAVPPSDVFSRDKKGPGRGPESRYVAGKLLVDGPVIQET